MPYIELGTNIKDKVSGLKGIATARLEYLNGCTQYAISGKVQKDGKLPDSYYVDHNQLIILDGPKVEVEPKDVGGATTNRPM